MAETKTKSNAVVPAAEAEVAAETVSRAEFDQVVAERNKLATAVDKLIDAMARRYAQDLYNEVLGK